MNQKGRLFIKQFAIFSLALLLFLAIVCGGLASSQSLETYENITISDYFPPLGTNVTWAVNLTLLGTDNSSASINGITMPYGGGGTTATPANWTYHEISYKPEDILDMTGNCTYTELTIRVRALADNASQDVMDEQNVTVNNVSALPCVESYGVSSLSTDASNTNSSQIRATISYYTSLNTYVNLSKEADATLDYCEVVCETSAGNVTYWMPEQTYNSTHEYCPYDCTDLSNTEIEVVYNEPLDVNDEFVIVFGLLSLAAGWYGIRRRSR